MADQLPKKICSNCFHCVLNFHNFTIYALKADKKLTEYFENFKPVFKKEPNEWEGVDKKCFKQAEGSTNAGFDMDNKDYSYSTDSYIDSDTFNMSETSVESQFKSKNLKCDVCNKRFKKQWNYKHHMQMHVKDFNCTICQQLFQDNNSYIQHLLKHQEDPKEKFLTHGSNPNNNQNLICEICSFSFKSIPSLSAHQKAHIPKNRVLQCAICKKIFKKISHLKRHELTHDDNRLYKCSMCPKSFATDDNLKVHINKHKGIKNNHCPICAKMFSHIESLTRHIKLHTREKPYLCPTCGKMFDSSTNLNQHMKRHTGLRLYACNLCPGKFISKGKFVYLYYFMSVDVCQS